METIENIAADQNYCEMTEMFSNDELKSWTVHQAFTQSYEYSSSPEGAASTASKTMVSERKRRKKLNDKLLELRGAVPKISKLDKASTLKDAIVYIQDLQEQERRLQAEIMELESKSLKKDPGFDFEQELPVLLRPKKSRYGQIYDHRAPISYPIKVHELRVNSMGEKTLLVSLTCSKARDAMIKICEIFESMKLKIITANVAIVSGMVKKTVLIEADMEEKDNLIIKIERAFSAVSDPDSHLSMQSKTCVADCSSDLCCRLQFGLCNSSRPNNLLSDVGTCMCEEV